MCTLLLLRRYLFFRASNWWCLNIQLVIFRFERVFFLPVLFASFDSVWLICINATQRRVCRSIEMHSFWGKHQTSCAMTDKKSKLPSSIIERDTKRSFDYWFSLFFFIIEFAFACEICVSWDCMILMNNLQWTKAIYRARNRNRGNFQRLKKSARHKSESLNLSRASASSFTPKKNRKLKPTK